MKTESELIDQFSRLLLTKIELQGYPHWLKKLTLKMINQHKVVLGGIQHEVYRFDIKRNHVSLVTEVLNEICPEQGPFNEKSIHFDDGSDSLLTVNNTVEKEFLPPGTNESESCSVTPDLLYNNNTASKHSNRIRSSILPPFSKDKKSCEEINQLHNHQETDFQFNLKSFVAGERNLLASRACHAVTEMPGCVFNPFVIYGVTGSGKTHLLQGIGHELKQKHPSFNVVYITAEDFLNEFIQSIRNQGMEHFRNIYRTADLLLVDDLDLLGNAKQAQNELLHTLNHLRHYRKQIVITCRVSPSKISGLSEVLMNRLESGLVLDVGVPDSSGRIQILVRKAQEHGIPLSSDLAEFMAEHITGSVGRLEGALMRLGVHATLLNEPLSIELAQMNLRDLIGRHIEEIEQQQGSVKEGDLLKDLILERVSTHFQVTIMDLCSKRRDQRVLKARQATIYLFKETSFLSLSEIGRILGRTHSTVHSSLRKVYQRMKSDEFYRRQLYQLRDELDQNRSTSLPQTRLELKRS